MMPTLHFITHPEVLNDLSVPVPEWPLSPEGTVHYDAQTRSTWVGPHNATVPPTPPGQLLNNVTLNPAPGTNRFGTFNSGKHP